jgi:urea transporter
MIQYCGPRLTMGILVCTSILVLLSGVFGFLGEKPTKVPQESQWMPGAMSSWCCSVYLNLSNYRAHKRIFLLAMFISAAAMSLSIVVLVTSNWTARFICVLFVAISVALAVYFGNKKHLPSVANVALFIFLREALSPDIETTMFYW